MISKSAEREKKEETHRSSKRQNDYAIRAMPNSRARFTLTQWDCARSFVGIFSSSFRFESRSGLWEKLTNTNLWRSPQTLAHSHTVHARTMERVDRSWVRTTYSMPEKMLSLRWELLIIVFRFRSLQPSANINCSLFLLSSMFSIRCVRNNNGRTHSGEHGAHVYNFNITILCLWLEWPKSRLFKHFSPVPARKRVCLVPTGRTFRIN